MFAPLPLEMLSPGERGVVEDVYGDPGWVGRMADMGIRPGCCLQVLRAGVPCLLQVGDCRLCLRNENGAGILVRPVT